LCDLGAHRTRPGQDRVDCIAQRAKLSPSPLSSLSGCAIFQIRRDCPLVKFVNFGWFEGHRKRVNHKHLVCAGGLQYLQGQQADWAGVEQRDWL
jgi:hypothetical protein